MTTEVDNAIRRNMLAFAMKAFAQLYPGKQLVPHDYVKLLALHLERVADGKTKRLVVTLPPRHLKTFLASICLAAWVLAHKPAAKILIVSYGQELADKIAYSVRAIMTAEWFCKLFRTRLAKNRSKLSDFGTTGGGYVRSVSIDGGITGLGADLVIVDDPAQIRDCDNTKQLDHINEVFESTVRTRLDNPKKSAIVIVAHRLADDDLPGHVLNEGGWKEVRLPLIAPRSRTYEVGDFVWHRKKGDLLRPDAFTSRDIERLRSMKRPGFETLQQQKPGAHDHLRIKREHFATIVAAELPADTPMVLSIDPAQKGGPAHSYGVIQAWAVHEGRYALVAQWREQTRYVEFRTEVRRFIGRYRPSAILIEATGQGPALLSEIRPQRDMDVVAITPHDDKLSRLRKHKKVLRSRCVALADGAPWVAEFIDEIVVFPYAPFDDQVDALTQFLDWISRNPRLGKRPARALVCGTSSSGITLPPRFNTKPAMEIPGAVLAHRLPFRRW